MSHLRHHITRGRKIGFKNSGVEEKKSITIKLPSVKHGHRTKTPSHNGDDWYTYMKLVDARNVSHFGQMDHDLSVDHLDPNPPL